MFEVLQANHPGRFAEGQLRTLQRQVRRFRAAHGDERDVVLGQRHRPGEAMQTDLTSTTELRVTVCGEPLSQKPAVQLDVAVLQLALGDGVLLRIDRGDTAGRSTRAVSAGARY